jgi:protein subunit release factor A
LPLILTLQPHRGGEEARLFAADLLRMYQRAARRFGVQSELLDIQSEGSGIRQATLKLRATNLTPFAAEGGLHAVQRITHSRQADRIHTSIVQVTAI